MINNPVQWEIIASMDQVKKDHPDWTEDQCRDEFNRIVDYGVKKMLDEQDNRRYKRKKKS